MLKNDLTTNGTQIMPNGNNYDYSTGCNPSTAYTLCVVALDNESRTGPLTQMNITTKSAGNQPIALINLISCSGGTADFSIVKNSSCAYYSVLVVNPFNNYMDAPDILFAMLLHQGNYTTYSENQVITNYTPSYQGWTGVITIGYTSSNAMSGVIYKKVFNAGSGAVVN